MCLLLSARSFALLASLLSVSALGRAAQAPPAPAAPQDDARPLAGRPSAEVPDSVGELPSRAMMEEIVERARTQEAEAEARYRKAIADATVALEARLPKLEEIQPRPLAPFPDDPPPHEGAMIDLPIVVEPPDLLIVEVLEALAGRPISGERLVRPDGTISLGFYGTLHVRGLTLEQIKTKLILHLRKVLSDEVLGLLYVDEEGAVTTVMPEESDRVVVDMSGYNSRMYYVEGDVSAPGRLPCTGNETVLDALNYVGGLLPSADRGKVLLVRPARGGKPAKSYSIDLSAISAGDVRANLQVLPGDRLMVARRADAAAADDQERLHTERKRLAEEARWAAEMAETFLRVKKDTPPAGMEALRNSWSAFAAAWSDPKISLDQLRARQRAWLATLLEPR